MKGLSAIVVVTLFVSSGFSVPLERTENATVLFNDVNSEEVATQVPQEAVPKEDKVSNYMQPKVSSSQVDSKVKKISEVEPEKKSDSVLQYYLADSVASITAIPVVSKSEKVDAQSPIFQDAEKKVVKPAEIETSKKVASPREQSINVEKPIVPVEVQKSPVPIISEKSEVRTMTETKSSAPEVPVVKDVVVQKLESPVVSDSSEKVADVFDVKKAKDSVAPQYLSVDSVDRPEEAKDAITTLAPPSGYSGDKKIEEGSADALSYLSEPINQATKLLMDLDEQIKGYLNTEVSTFSPHSYGAEEPQSSGLNNKQDEQLGPMIAQIENTLVSIDHTIDDLMGNRRYMSAAMMRSMRTYLRGVQNNLVRLQNRLRAVQAVVTSGTGSVSSGAQASPTAGGSVSGIGFPSNVFFDSLRDRINRITSDITNLMYRMSQTLGTATSSTARP